MYPHLSKLNIVCVSDCTYPCRISVQKGIGEWVRAVWDLQPEQPDQSLHGAALCTTDNKNQTTHKANSVQLQKTHCLFSLPASGIKH